MVTFPSVKTLPNDQIMRVDAVSSTVIYIGYARLGSLTSQAVWQIQKVEITGTEVAVLWADGDNAYNNIWDNRGSITYG